MADAPPRMPAAGPGLDMNGTCCCDEPIRRPIDTGTSKDGQDVVHTRPQIMMEPLNWRGGYMAKTGHARSWSPPLISSIDNEDSGRSRR